MNAQGAITWAAGAPGGSSGGSLEFDGSAENLGTGIASAALGDYTISLWINTDSASQSWFVGTGNRGLHLGTRDTANAGDGSNTLSQGHWGNDSDGTTTILANTWYHATFTYDNTTDTQTMYVNGNAEGAGIVTGDPNNTSTDIIIGNRDNTRGPSWDGQLDDIAIWDSVLTPAEIADLASGAQGPMALGAGAYWDFEDSQAGTTAAIQGTGLNGADLTGITAAVPEPSSLALALLGVAGFMRRKRA